MDRRVLHVLPVPARRITQIALPAIGESYLLSLLGVVDMLFIARLGLVEIDAVGVTNIFGMTYSGVFAALSAALSVFLARSVGAGSLSQGRSAVWHGMVSAFMVGLLAAVLSVLFARPLLHLMGAYGVLELAAMPYFTLVLAMSPLIALFTAQSAAFRATGDTRTPLRVGFEMNVIHVILDYFLIFGIGAFPGLGLRGVALATLLARLYALVRLLYRSRRVEAIRITAAAMKMDLVLLMSMIRFAVPAALERLAKRLGQVIYFGLIVRMGVDVYAAHNIAGTWTVFASTIGDGFATAALATIAQAIGASRFADVEAYRRWSYRQAAVSMTLVTAVLWLGSPWLGQLFTHNQTALQLLIVVLAIDTVSQPFLAAVLVDAAAIQAGGNSTYPMIVTTLGIWAIRTLGVYVFAWRLGYGLPAVWVSIAVDNAVRSCLFAWYRKRSRWIRELPGPDPS